MVFMSKHRIFRVFFLKIGLWKEILLQKIAYRYLYGDGYSMSEGEIAEKLGAIDARPLTRWG